jgi:flagellar basal body-associated protein FliL
MDVLSAQNFSIRNKIVKIVTDIDDREVSEEGVRELIQTIIGEIDDCIGLLQ